MGVFRKNNKWWIDYYVGRRRIRIPVEGGKRKAEDLLSKKKVDIMMGRHQIPNHQKVKFVDFAMKYLKDYSAIDISVPFMTFITF